jgi:hypothetical protein
MASFFLLPGPARLVRRALKASFVGARICGRGGGQCAPHELACWQHGGVRLIRHLPATGVHGTVHVTVTLTLRITAFCQAVIMADQL